LAGSSSRPAGRQPLPHNPPLRAACRRHSSLSLFLPPLPYRIRVIHELRQLVEQKEQFIALMSHELRTPLNGIIGLSNALLMDSAGDVGTLGGGSAGISLVGGSGGTGINSMGSSGSSGGGNGLAPDTAKTLTTIRNSGARLLNLINDILDAAAMRKGAGRGGCGLNSSGLGYAAATEEAGGLHVSCSTAFHFCCHTC
jgi:signal transduction histidine kinase